MDDVEDALKKSNGLNISTDSLKPLVDLLRALRERLSDSQSNLKPVAARIIGTILGSVDSASQAKLGRIAFAPLVGAVCNDNRKPMREASLEAIRVGTTASSVEGGEPNSSSLECSDGCCRWRAWRIRVQGMCPKRYFCFCSLRSIDGLPIALSLSGRWST